MHHFIRYHHSISDGIAILRLFCKDLIDKRASITIKQAESRNPHGAKYVTVKETITGRFLLRMALTAPRFLIHELFFKKELNRIHNGSPSDDKITSWVSEDVSASSLVCTIRNVKQLSPGVSFTDVFLTAFATSFRSYCKMFGNDVPASLTLAVMRRFERETSEIRLRNRSSAVFQTVPIGDLPVAGVITCTTELLRQIHAINIHSNAVRMSTAPVTTYLSVFYLPELLPAPIVRPLLARSKFSIAMSNIPAFESEIYIREYALKDAIFWVPNIGKNMLGLSLMTWNGRLKVGLIADRRIIPSLDELDKILHGTIRELQNMSNVLANGA